MTLLKNSRYPIHIRFNDLDSYGIVNNAIYLTYFEEGRKLWFNDHIGTKWDWQTQGILLAHHEIDYLQPITLMDEAEIELYLGRIGNTSFDVHYNIFKKSDTGWEQCTKGKSVIVCFDYAAKKPIPVPEQWKTAFSNA